MAKTRKSNTEFEMNTGANESVAKASMKKKTEKSCGEGITLVDIGSFSISTTSVLVKIRNARKVIE